MLNLDTDKRHCGTKYKEIRNGTLFKHAWSNNAGSISNKLDKSKLGHEFGGLPRLFGLAGIIE